MKRTLIGGEDATAVARAVQAIWDFASPHGFDDAVDARRVNPGAGPHFRAVLRTEADLLLTDAANWPRTSGSREAPADREKRAWVLVLCQLAKLDLLPG